MKNEKDFYDIIRSKFNEKETPFDEGNWQAMREMIDASRTSKKRVLWLVASLSLLLCAGGAFSIYYTGHNTNNKSNIVSTSVPIPNSSEITKVNSEQTLHTTTSANSTNTQSAKVTTNKVNDHSANQDSRDINTSEKQVSSNENPMEQTASNTIVHKKISKGSRYISKSGSNELVSANSLTSSSANSSIKGEMESNAISNNSVAENNKQNNSSNQKISTVNPVSSTPNPTTTKATASVAKTHSDKADSAAAADALPQRFSSEPRIFAGKTNMFSIDADLEYSGGWEIGSVDQGKGLNVGAGIGYSHYIGSRFFLKTGLQFSTFGNMSPLTYNYQHSVGHTIYDSVITTKRLYFIKVPFQAEFFVGRNKRSSIGAGGSVWFLVGNTGYSTTYQQTDNNTPPVNVQTYSQNASLNGYSKINFSLQVQYRYVFSRKFSMYFIMYSELTNMKDNSFFGESIAERTSRAFQCMLSYNL